jgi:hypothetical protein
MLGVLPTRLPRRDHFFRQRAERRNGGSIPVRNLSALPVLPVADGVKALPQHRVSLGRFVSGVGQGQADLWLTLACGLPVRAEAHLAWLAGQRVLENPRLRALRGDLKVETIPVRLQDGPVLRSRVRCGFNLFGSQFSRHGGKPRKSSAILCYPQRYPQDLIDKW